MEIERPFAASTFLYDSKKHEVLLHLRDGNARSNRNKWSFFGGRAKGEETPVECAKREILEELSINIEATEFNYLRHYRTEDENRMPWQYVFYIENDMPKSKMKLTEGADFDWIYLDKAFDLDLTDDARESLRVFIEKIRK